MFNFGKLEAWRKSVELADLVDRTTRSFPADEHFGPANQIRRTAVSVSSNLAEGCSRSSRQNFERLAEIAPGSEFEATSPAVTARNQGCLREADFVAIQESVLEIARMLSGLRQSLLPDSD